MLDILEPKDLEHQSGADFNTLRGAFAAFDADGDGKLTKAEVIAALTRKTGHGTELSKDVAETTWKRWRDMFDLNNDETVSVDELARWKPALGMRRIEKLSRNQWPEDM